MSNDKRILRSKRTRRRQLGRRDRGASKTARSKGSVFGMSKLIAWLQNKMRAHVSLFASLAAAKHVGWDANGNDVQIHYASLRKA